MGHESSSSISSVVLFYKTYSWIDNKQSDDPNKVLPIWRLSLQKPNPTCSIQTTYTTNRIRFLFLSLQICSTTTQRKPKNFFGKKKKYGTHSSIGKSNGHDSCSFHHPWERVPHKPQKLEKFALLKHTPNIQLYENEGENTVFLQASKLPITEKKQKGIWGRKHLFLFKLIMPKNG